MTEAILNKAIEIRKDLIEYEDMLKRLNESQTVYIDFSQNSNPHNKSNAKIRSLEIIDLIREKLIKQIENLKEDLKIL